MKICDWCGSENDDGAVVCKECGTQQFKTPSTDPAGPGVPIAAPGTIPPQVPDAAPESTAPRWEFRDLTPQEMELDLVTLVRCRTLPEADLVVSELDGAGIDAFIPDEYLSQALSWNLNAYGYVRVQVSPKDYQAAKELLLASPSAPEGPAPSDAGQPESGKSE